MDEPEVEVDDTNIQSEEAGQQEPFNIDADTNNNTDAISLNNSVVDTKNSEDVASDSTVNNMDGSNVASNFGQDPSPASIYPKEEAFFATCPLTIVDEVYDKVDDYLNDAFDDLERRLVLSAATVSVENLEKMVKDKSNSNNASSDVAATTGGSLKGTLPSSIPSILNKHFNLDADKIKSISFEHTALHWW